MSKLQIYLHGENVPAPKFVEIVGSETLNDLIKIYQEQFPNSGQPDEIDVFMEDAEEAKEKVQSVDDAGIKHRSHIHCHRCKKTEVTVIYNGDDKSFEFAPAIKVKHVLKKAISGFGINESDAGDYLLKLDDKTVLQLDEHIGSFTSYPRCQIKLFLTAKKPIQG
jgi:hypothetical protein